MFKWKCWTKKAKSRKILERRCSREAKKKKLLKKKLKVNVPAYLNENHQKMPITCQMIAD